MCLKNNFQELTNVPNILIIEPDAETPIILKYFNNYSGPASTISLINKKSEPIATYPFPDINKRKNTTLLYSLMKINSIIFYLA